MAQNRPDKPSVTLPDDFGGTKTAFDSELVENGYEASMPEVLEGGNLNYMLDGLFQNTKYMRAVLDYVRDTPIGKMFWVNQNGQMDYIQPSVIATDEEFTIGTATDKTPNVKQVADKFALKVDTTAMQTYVTSTVNTLLSSLYPVGSLYIGTQSTCPMTSLITGSTWALVASDKALWTGNGSNGNTTKAAGLPNFTQDIGYTGTNGNGGPDGRADTYNSGWIYPRCNNSPNHVYVKPSTVNSIYGNSNTVQPPAYVVNVWRRTA